MDEAREHAISLAYIVLAVTVGLAIGNPLVSGVVVGLGTGALGPLTQRAWRRCCQRLLAGDSPINHDLERALRTAFSDAIAHLEERWWLEPRGAQIKRARGEDYAAAKSVFAILREDAERILSGDRLHALVAGPESVRLLDAGAEHLQQEVAASFASYLHGHDEQLQGFLTNNLSPAVSLFFGEYLKGGKPEQQRAWRAFQKILLGGLQDTLGEVHLSQTEMAATLAKLVAWADRLETRLIADRDPIGEAALEEILTGLRAAMVQAIEREHDVTRRVIAETMTLEQSATRAEIAASREDIASLGQDVVPRLEEIRALIVAIQPALATPRGPDAHVPGTLPAVWNVPHGRNPNFTGRERELAMLAEALAAEENAAAIQAMHGLGGIGKTQIAVEYAYRHAVDRDDYSRVWWVRSEEPATLAADYASLARPLGLPAADEPDQAAAIAAVRAWLEQSGEHWLLIFDNADMPAEIRPYLPRAGAGDVVITSRHPGWRAFATPIEIEKLPAEDAIAFLRTRTGRDEPAAADLAEELGWLPLALEQAAAYIVARDVSIAWYLKQFQTHHGRLLERAAPGTAYPWTVATAWELALQQLQEQAPAARDLLALCAFLAPDDIPLDVLAAGAEFLPSPLAETLTDDLELRDAIAALDRYSLVDVIDDMTVSVHRLVQLVVRDGLDPAERGTWTAAGVAVVRAAFPENSHEFSTWPACARLLSHGLMATRHAVEAGPVPAGTADLLGRVAMYLRAQARFAEARGLFVQTLTILEATLPLDHASIAEIFAWLGTLLRDQGDLAGARERHERALAIQEAVLPANHPDIAGSLNNLGNVLRAQGELDGARERLERSLAICEAVLPMNHPHLAVALNNLGVVLIELGDLAGARQHYERALAIHEGVLPPNLPAVAISLNNVGNVLREQGDLTGARERLERSLAICEAVYPPNHPRIAVCLSTLGWILLDQGELLEARDRLERALAIREAALRPDHPETASSLDSLGNVLRAQGDLLGARERYERALAMREAVYPPDHSLIAESLSNLGKVSLLEGDLDGATSALRRALPMFQAKALKYGEAIVLSRFGKVALARGRPFAALDLFVASDLIAQELQRPIAPTDQMSVTELAEELGLDEPTLAERVAKAAASYRQDQGARLLAAAFLDQVMPDHDDSTP